MVPGARCGMGIHYAWARVNLLRLWKCIKTGSWGWLHNLVKLQKTIIDLKQVNFMVYNYISTHYFFKKDASRWVMNF